MITDIVVKTNTKTVGVKVAIPPKIHRGEIFLKVFLYFCKNISSSERFLLVTPKIGSNYTVVNI